MTLLMDLNLGLAALNTLLALALGVVYWRNHQLIRSNFTLALVIFGAFLLFHNGLLLYHYLTMMPVFYSLGEGLLLVENVLQSVALGALLWATMR